MGIDADVQPRESIPRAQATPRERRLTGLGAGLVFALVALRSSFGADLSDDGHAVALILRLADGAQPFRDELNIQSLGAIPAAVPTWLWQHAFGLTGVVLANRLFYCLLAAATGWLAYRALRTRLTPGLALCTCVAPLLAPAYGLLVTSYNTMPVLALLLGTSSALAAQATRRRGWVALSAVAFAIGATCYPPLVVGGALILLSLAWLLRSRRDLLLAGIIGGLIIAVPVTLWYLFVLTPHAVRATLDFTNEFLGDRASPSRRLDLTSTYYARNIVRIRYWPTWLFAIVAVLPRIPRWLRALAVALVPVAAFAASLLGYLNGSTPFAKVPAVYVIIVIVALLPALVLAALRDRQGVVADLLRLGFLASIAQAGVILLTTSSGPAWGIPSIGLVPLLMATVVMLGEAAHDLPGRLGRLGPWPAIAIVSFLLCLLGLSVFKSGPPWTQTSRVDSGAFAGVFTTPGTDASLTRLTGELAAVVKPDEPVLIYGNPGAYLLTSGTPDTPIVWMVNYGAANHATVGYFTGRHTPPRVVLVHVGQVDAAKGWERLAAQDPFVRWLLPRYAVAPERTGPFFVLTARAGATLATT